MKLQEVLRGCNHRLKIRPPRHFSMNNFPTSGCGQPGKKLFLYIGEKNRPQAKYRFQKAGKPDNGAINVTFQASHRAEKGPWSRSSPLPGRQKKARHKCLASVAGAGLFITTDYQ